MIFSLVMILHHVCFLSYRLHGVVRSYRSLFIPKLFQSSTNHTKASASFHDVPPLVPNTPSRDSPPSADLYFHMWKAFQDE